MINNSISIYKKYCQSVDMAVLLNLKN